MSVDFKPSEVLDKAADLITPEGAWTQGAFARDCWGRGVDELSDRGVCFCAFGALIRVVSPASQRYVRGVQFLRHATQTIDVVGWNDAPERTQAEVVEALRKAAELARAEGQ